MVRPRLNIGLQCIVPSRRPKIKHHTDNNHQALQHHQDQHHQMMLAVATTLAAALLPGAFAIPVDDATAMHRALQGLQIDIDVNGEPHLYFHSIDPLFRTCSHVDAAPFMPAELFEPANIVALWTHVPRVFPLRALIPRVQGSSGAVATVQFAWRGHAKTPTTRAGPWPDFALRLE